MDNLLQEPSEVLAKIADQLQDSHPEFDSILIIVTTRGEERAGGIVSCRGNHFASAGACMGWMRDQGL